MDTPTSFCRAVGRVTTFSKEDLELMRWFRRWSHINRRTSDFYYQHSAELLAKMEAQGAGNWTEFVGFERAVLTLLRAKQTEAAYQLYRDTITELVLKYWPDCDLPLWHLLYQDYQVPEIAPVSSNLPDAEHHDVNLGGFGA